MAIPVPPEVRRELQRQVDTIRGELPPARWVKSHQWHLTLVFLGEISELALRSVRTVLAAVTQRHPSFRLVLGGGGVFPPRGRARVAWVGVDSSGLVTLQQAVFEALSTSARVDLESRPFHPHLTLARPRSPWSRGTVKSYQQLMDQPWGTWTASTLHLMGSELLPQGTRHHCLHEYSLS